MGLLNKIYALVQAGRCLFNILCNYKFEQSGADLRVFCKSDDGEVEMWCLCTWMISLLMPKRR